MHTITVSNDHHARLVHLAQEAGQTVEELVVDMIIWYEADVQDERNIDEAIRSPEITSLLTQLHDAL